MTETELKERLSAGVDGIDAPPDLLDRARLGGARRLRRRRFLSLSAAAVSVVVAGGVAVTAPAIVDHLTDSPVASTPRPGDPYAFLMNGPTRGDLAGDEAYLRDTLTAWRTSHRKSANYSRGIFDRMQGNAKVAWAGNTPGGRAAIVVEYSDLRKHSDVQLDHEGVATLIGFVGEDKDGRPAVIGDGYPVPGASMAAGFVVGKAGSKALVTVQLGGKKIGWSAGRTYAANGSVTREFTPLQFVDQVSVVKLPAGQNLSNLRISRLPVPQGFSDLSIVNGDVNASPPEQTDDRRLWTGFPDYAFWPMTAGADSLRGTASDRFDSAISAVSDKTAYGVAYSIWVGYGVTADGTAVYLGEQQLDADPTRVYAVLTPKSGKTTIVPGGIPDRNAVLPVSIKLPGGQGWAVARRDARLSYRSDGGAWSAARSSALLVPAGANAEVRVEIDGKTEVVALR